MNNPEIKKIVTIYAEATPNPETLKFVLNKPLVSAGVFEFERNADVTQSPAAQMLFGFEFVNSVFIMGNFISVTKKPDVKWVDIIPSLKDSIKSFVEAGNKAVSDELIEKIQSAEPASDDEVVSKIKQILDNQIKPAVEMDGGFIEFKAFEDGVVKLILRGACSGCPSSMVTLKAGIEGMMKRFIPEVNEVVAEAM
jgi:NFU1 iron-sulfur cluster scaffold homolog, mitochondrial